MLLMNDMHVSKNDIAEFDRNWDEALALCRERSIRDIALGGDLFQSRSAQTLDVLLAVHVQPGPASVLRLPKAITTR